MGFSEKQVQALRRSLNSRHVRAREANGRELSYIEGWFAISEANRIFGFDAWSRETVETRCVLARENRGSFVAVYVARVRITVHATGRPLSAKAMGRARVVVPRRAKSTTSLSKRRNRRHQTGAGDFRQTVRTRALPEGQERHPRTLAHAAAGHCSFTTAASYRFASRRHDTDPAAVALLRAATTGLDD